MVEEEESHDDGGEEGDQERYKQEQVRLEPLTALQRDATPAVTELTWAIIVESAVSTTIGICILGLRGWHKKASGGSSGTSSS